MIQRDSLRRTTRLVSVFLFAALALGAPSVQANEFLVWSSPSSGSGAGFSATVTSTVTAGSLAATTIAASDAAFVQDFAGSISALIYRSSASGPASITSTLSFSPALPDGARLIAVDLDFSGEQFTLSGGGAPLALVEQRETNAGASSTFPSYSPGTGVLLTQAPTPNDSEASVFDVSGLSAIDVDFAGGTTNSGSFIAIAVPVAVPSLPPFGVAALAFALLLVAVSVLGPSHA